MDRFREYIQSLWKKNTGIGIIYQLGSADVSDYERGVIQGRIDMLSEIRREIEDEAQII